MDFVKTIKSEGASQGLRILAFLIGLVGANLAKKQLALSSLMGAVGVLIVGYGIAVFAPAKDGSYSIMHFVKDAGAGAAAFGANDVIGNLTAPVVTPGVAGLSGFTLPAGIRKALSRLHLPMGNINDAIPYFQHEDGQWKSYPPVKQIAGLGKLNNIMPNTSDLTLQGGMGNVISIQS